MLLIYHLLSYNHTTSSIQVISQEHKSSAASWDWTFLRSNPVTPTRRAPTDMNRSHMQKALQDQAEQLKTLILHDHAEHPAEKGFVKGTL